MAELRTTSLYERAAQRLGDRTDHILDVQAARALPITRPRERLGAAPAFFSAGSGSPVIRAASSFAVLHELAARLDVVAGAIMNSSRSSCLLALARPPAAVAQACSWR